MPKSYSEQLAAWVRQRPPSGARDQNLVAFLAVKQDVTEALAAGWAIKTVWRHLQAQNRIGFSYDPFRRFVNQYIRCTDSNKAGAMLPAFDRELPAAPLRPPSPTQTVQFLDTAPQADSSQERSGFVFHPAPNLDELI
jgi:hypothetical protein